MTINYKNVLLGCSTALFSIILNTHSVLAACLSSDCSGYTKTAADCSGKDSLRCPFDDTKYYCPSEDCSLYTEANGWYQYTDTTTSSNETSSSAPNVSELQTAYGVCNSKLGNYGIDSVTATSYNLTFRVGAKMDCGGNHYTRCIDIRMVDNFPCGIGLQCKSGYCNSNNVCAAPQTCEGYKKGTGFCMAGQTKSTCTDAAGQKYYKCEGESEVKPIDPIFPGCNFPNYAISCGGRTYCCPNSSYNCSNMGTNGYFACFTVEFPDLQYKDPLSEPL